MILVTGDIHLNDLIRDQHRHDFMANILPAMLKKHRATTLLVLGDLSDEKDRHSAWLVNQTVDHFTALTKICPVIIQMGNHDYVSADNPFFEFLGSIPGITWITNPTVGRILPGDLGKRLGKSLFLPHTHNYKRDWDELSLKGFKGFDLIFAHQTFQGAKIGPRTLEGIPTDIFPEEATVISGDIHQPQAFDQVIYVGSPYLVNFGDDFKPRVLLLEREHSGPGAKTIGRSIPCPGPQKRLLEISSINELKKQSRMLNEGDILKVRVALKSEDHAQWPTLKKQVMCWGEENGFSVFLVQPKVERGASLKTKRKVDTKTDEAFVEAYGHARSVKEDTLKTGLSLMRKV